MDELDIKEIPIPESWPEDAKAMVRFLLKRIEKLEKENRELRARLNQDSSNSNRPSSQDPSWKKKRRSRRPSGRNPGGQKGHRGRNRPLLPADQVHRFESLKPTICADCGFPLSEEAPSVSLRRFQQIELPQIRPIVTEYRLHGIGCANCGHTSHASLPPAVGNRCMGPRLQAFSTFLTGRMRMSRRMTVEFLEILLGPAGRVSLGCISESEEDMSQALAAPYSEALAFLSKSQVAHADETGWRMMGDTAWLWVATNETVSAFRVDASRGGEAFTALLKGFDGILVSDRWSAYQKVPLKMRQLCWAHLKRDFQKIIDRKAGAESLGRWAHREITAIFELWHAFLDGEIPHASLITEFVSIKARFARLLKRGINSQDEKAQRTCKRILKVWPALWTFIQHQGAVEPTNNNAERALRPAVIWRKLSFGCQSDRGRQFVERFLTTVTSLRQQGRQVVDFLEYALKSFRTGMDAPSLLPIPSG